MTSPNIPVIPIIDKIIIIIPINLYINRVPPEEPRCCSAQELVPKFCINHSVLITKNTPARIIKMPITMFIYHGLIYPERLVLSEAEGSRRTLILYHNLQTYTLTHFFHRILRHWFCFVCTRCQNLV